MTTTPEEQKALLDRCLQRQPGAWEEFVDRFAGLIVHVVRYAAESRSIFLAEQDLEDHTAEVFLQLIDRDMAVLRAFRGESSLATYLTVVARRIVVRDLLARREILSVLRQTHLRRQAELASGPPPLGGASASQPGSGSHPAVTPPPAPAGSSPDDSAASDPPPVEPPPYANGSARHHAVARPPVEEAAETDNPLARIDDEDLIDSMLATLDDREAEVLRLRYRDELSYEEIHARTGIAENSIGSILSRAKEKLCNNGPHGA